MKNIEAAGSITLPKISIITPSFNQGKYLEETILSIVSQSYDNYELIIIDAGSTDDTLKVIDKYKEWITYWVSEPDRGQSHAIQKGLDRATGDIVNWINSDDLVAPGAFHQIAAEFDLAKYDVICGNCDYFFNDVAHLDLRNERMEIYKSVGDTLLGRKINQPSTFFKASVIKELGIDEQFHYTMDLELWYRYLLRAGQGRILLSDSLFSYFRLHESSKTVSQLPRFEEDVRKVFYNVVYSLGQPATLLAFMRQSVADAGFEPKRYVIGISIREVSSFIRSLAWAGMLHYNETGSFAAARECLAIARLHGQPLNLTVARQLVKHYLMPSKLLHWLRLQSSVVIV